MEENMYKEARVLVVDDIEEVLSATKSTLKFEGMNVITYSNPKEALEFLKNNKIDVLLLDFFMPEMNGDRFIEELRKFNNETVIILRTGYSDKVPPMEMLDSLNIQGYIDKLKGDDELVLMTKSAIKTAYLYKKLLEQKNEINKLQYGNEFLGKFFGKVLGQIREESMIIGPLSDFLANNEGVTEEERRRFAEEINVAIGKLVEMTKTMELGNLGEVSISKLNEILNNLLDLELKMKYAKINFEYKEDIVLKCDSKILIYMLVEIIEVILENEKIININIYNSTITIENKINNEELINKLKKIAEFDSNFKISTIDSKISIEI